MQADGRREIGARSVAQSVTMRCTPQMADRSQSTSTNSRRLGQVFTPRPIADWMASWACEHGPRSVLDPAVGHGVFVEAVESILHVGGGKGRSPSSVPRIDVCEIDATMLRRFKKVRRCLPIRCRREDFITARFDGAYDAIIANPPYVRHHEMQYGDAVWESFDDLCARRLSRMTNLYGLFLLKIWSLLADGGRAAIITPAEWLNADFGAKLKACLLEQNAIDGIVHFDHSANVFEGALTTAAITLLRRGRKRKEGVRLHHVSSIEELTRLSAREGRVVDRASLDPAAKWTPLFTTTGVKRQGGPTLADVAKCSRGIATGANDFFALRESDRQKWGIDLLDLSLCITKAQQVPGTVLTKAAVQKLIDADQRVYLLSPRARLNAAVKRYLDEGLRRGIDKRHLSSHRPVWYRPENRQPAPILVSVFARGDFRFILNKAGVQNLTAFHTIYPHDGRPAHNRALFEYLSSPAAHRALADHRRVYADGLQKLEPRDVEAISIPDSLL